MSKIAVRALLVGLAVSVSSCQQHVERIRLESGREYDLISMTQGSRVDAGTGRPETWVMLNYYGIEREPVKRVAEADSMLELAAPIADSIGASGIVVKQTYPVIARWTGAVTGYVFQYRKSSTGKWRREQS